MNKLSDGAFANLSVSKTLFINDIVVDGSLRVDPDKLQDNNFGVFVSTDDNLEFRYAIDVLPDGTYVDLYHESNVNSTMTTRIAEKHKHPGTIRLTNMHYEHVLSDDYVYRFMSDKTKLLLTSVDKNCAKTMLLTKKIS